MFTNITAVIFGLGVAYLLLSVRIVNEGKVAAIYRLARRRKVVKSGIYLVWMFIDKMHIFSTHNHRVTIPPGAKENIQRRDDIPLLPGQVYPVRIIHESAESALHLVPEDPKVPSSPYVRKFFEEFSESEQKRMLKDDLQSSITTEVIAYVNWDLSKMDQDPDTLFSFVENIGSVKAADMQIVGTVKSSLQELMAPITARNSINAKKHLETETKHVVEDLVGEPRPGQPLCERPWGINVSDVKIVEWELGKTINQARAGGSASIKEAEATVNKARADAKATKLQANADAYKERKTGEARNASFSAQAEILATEGGFRAAQLEAAKDVLGKAGTVIVPGDLGGIIGSLSAIAKNVVK